MSIRVISLTCLCSVTMLFSQVGGAISKPSGPSGAQREITAGIGSVDAISGQLHIKMPVGPTLPGRLAIGWNYYFDDSSNGFGPGGGFDQNPPISYYEVVATAPVQQVRYHIDGKEVRFVSIPLTDVDRQAYKQILVDRGVDGHEYAVAGFIHQIDTVFASDDGLSFLVASRWRGLTGPNQYGDAAARVVIVSGDTVLWRPVSTSEQVPNSNPDTVTFLFEIRNRWGDWVRFTRDLDGSNPTLTSSLGHALTYHQAVDGMSGTISNNMGLDAIQIVFWKAPTGGSGPTAFSNATLGTYLQIGWQDFPNRYLWNGTRDLNGNPTYSTTALPIWTLTASGLKHEFEWSTDPSVSSPASEGFIPLSQTDYTPGAIPPLEGSWTGWEPVKYVFPGLVNEYAIGELKFAINKVKIRSTSAGEPGYRFEFLRTIPKPNGYDRNLGTISWSSTDYLTEVRRFPNPDATAGEPYRFTKFTHTRPVSTYGRVAWPGKVAQPLSEQRQMILFAFASVVQEEGGDVVNGVSNTRLRITYDGWSLKSYLNPQEVIVDALGIRPIATRVIAEHPLGDAPTVVRELLNWDGRSFATSRTVTIGSGVSVPSHDGTGRPTAAIWRGTESGDMTLSNSVSGSVDRTIQTTRNWNPSLVVFQTASTSSTVSGSEYFAMRGTNSLNLGTKENHFDVLGRLEWTRGTTASSVSTLTQYHLPNRPEVRETVREVTVNGLSVPLSGRAGEEFQYSGLWRTGVRQKPDSRWSTQNPDALGRTQAVSTEDGIVATTEYDTLGRAWRTRRLAKGSVPEVVTWTEFDPASRYIREHAQAHGAGEIVTEKRFDAFGRVISVTSAKGTTAERTVYTQYDGFGQKIRESLPTKPTATPVYSEWIFDVDGFLVQAKNTKGVVTATFYRPYWGIIDGLSGYISGVQGVRGGLQQDLRDLLGQLRRKTDAMGQIARMSYDAYGRLVQAERGGQVRNYSYNDMGWLLSQSQPEEGITTFADHTVSGMPLQIVKGTGSNATTTITSLFSQTDGGNREGLPKLVFASAGVAALGTAVSRNLDYDADRRLINVIETQINGSIAESYGYDDLSRLTIKTFTDGAYAFSVEQKLDAFGKVVELRYPAGGGKATRSVIPTYDSLHRPLGIAYSGNPIADIAYDQVINGENGERLTYANGAVTTWQHNAHEELSRVIHMAKNSANIIYEVENAAVSWTNDGFMNQRGADTFGYDQLGRLNLSTVDGVNGEKVQQSFRYDLYGNRSGVTSLSLIGTLPDEVTSYDLSIGSDNLIPPTTVAGVGTGRIYDALGRMTQIWAVPGNTTTQTSWTYDALGRVTSQAGSPVTQENYLLDGSGLRFKRIKADGTTQYTVYGFNREPLSTFEQLPATQGLALIGNRSLVTPKKSNLTKARTLALAPSRSVSTLAAPGVGGCADFVLVDPVGSTYSTGESIPFSVATCYPSTTWEFGDGTTASGDFTSHAYTSPGVFTVRVTGTDCGTGPISPDGPQCTMQVIQFTLTVVGPPVIRSFRANPSSINWGESALLNWDVGSIGVLNLTLSGGPEGSRAVTGGWIQVYPNVTTTYTLTASTPYGTSSSAVTVTVGGQVVLPIINSFRAYPANIRPGETTMLNWDVSGARTITLSSVGIVSGFSASVAPTITTTYLLTVSNEVGSQTATLTITVISPPTPGLIWKSDAVYGFGQVLYEQRGTQVLYQQGDHLGTPSILTTATGGVVGRQKSLPFGERFLGWGEKSVRRFTNHEDGIQLPIYMQARMYLPSYGRFAQVDPVYDQKALDPESWNLFSYVTNNPITKTDPDGMREISTSYGGGGADFTVYIEQMSDALLLPPPDAVIGYWGVSMSGKPWYTTTSRAVSKVESGASIVTATQNDTNTAQTASPEFDATKLPAPGSLPDAGSTAINAKTFPGLVGKIQGESEVIAAQMAAFPSDVNVKFVPHLLGDSNKGALAESTSNGRTWVVGVNLGAMAGSKIALAMRIAHELEHGLKFFNEFHGNISAWNAASDASRAMRNYSNLATKMYFSGRGSPIEQGLLRQAHAAQNLYFNNNPHETPCYQRSFDVYSEYMSH